MGVRARGVPSLIVGLWGTESEGSGDAILCSGCGAFVSAAGGDEATLSRKPGVRRIPRGRLSSSSSCAVTFAESKGSEGPVGSCSTGALASSASGSGSWGVGVLSS